MNESAFVEACQREGIELSQRQCQQFSLYRELLTEWNRKMNLTAITDPDQIRAKHFYDSIVPFAGLAFQSLCDIGSGAGFPGIPVQICFPQAQITLIEPLQKRCRFLEEVNRQLDLNMTILPARAEEAVQGRRESFDVVTSRAVARLTILLELCAPFAQVQGQIVALKGKAAQQELMQAQKAMELLGLEYTGSKEVWVMDAAHQNLYFQKKKKTDPKYPRNFGQIKKKPLGETIWEKS